MSSTNKPAVKKTRFQKEKEEREAKKRQEDAEAAKVYEQFVASFDAGDSSNSRGNKRFVRARNSRGHREGSPDHYQPPLPPPPSPPSSSDAAYPPRLGMPTQPNAVNIIGSSSTNERNSSGSVLPPSSLPSNTKKGSRQIDAFLEEIKQKQELGIVVSERDLPGSYDDGDPGTTNLHVSNLSPTTTEERLQEVFGRFGRVYSVKIMWPRTEDERARGRNTGFVSFHSRADAEDAKEQLHDWELDGHRLGIGWSKAVKKLANLSPATIVGGGQGHVAPPPGMLLSTPGGEDGVSMHPLVPLQFCHDPAGDGRGGRGEGAAVTGGGGAMPFLPPLPPPPAGVPPSPPTATAAVVEGGGSEGGMPRTTAVAAVEAALGGSSRTTGAPSSLPPPSPPPRLSLPRRPPSL